MSRVLGWQASTALAYVFQELAGELLRSVFPLECLEASYSVIEKRHGVWESVAKELNFGEI